MTDDPVRDADDYSADRDDRIRQLPVCEECGEHITDDYYYDIKGQFYCQRCIDWARTYF